MRGKVIVTRLNVRDRPGADATKLGVLSQNAIVDIQGNSEDWCEIRYAGQPAFISKRFIQFLSPTSLLKAKVNADILNVRNQPTAIGGIIGNVRRNALIDVVADHDDWLEIQFNQTPAYVSAKYVSLLDAGTTNSGTITAARLNVREQPKTDSKVIGSLGMGTQVSIRSNIGDWYEILFNGIPAFVSAKYVNTMISDEGAIPITANEAEPQAQTLATHIDAIPLAPDDKFDVYGSSKSQKVANTWNKYGRLLTTLGEQYEIEPACAIAVLCVESSGDGFRQDNQGRMVIRFENHKFWSFWGKQHSEEFNQYFKLNLEDKPWLGHKWRPSPSEDWLSFHGSQSREWQVLEFARRLDDTAALKSISMGAPQIMGFNYAQLDYPNVQTMFDKFSTDMRYQILGMFKFLSPGMLSALRKLDFTSFAGYYNGSGQKQQYGQWINEHYEAFKALAGQ